MVRHAMVKSKTKKQISTAAITKPNGLQNDVNRQDAQRYLRVGQASLLYILALYILLGALLAGGEIFTWNWLIRGVMALLVLSGLSWLVYILAADKLPADKIILAREFTRLTGIISMFGATAMLVAYIWLSIWVF